MQAKPGESHVINTNEQPIQTVPFIIAIARETDISLSMLGILACTAERPGLSLKHVAERLGIWKSKVSRGVDALVIAGHLERCDDPADRRQIRLTITASGQAVLLRLGGSIKAST